MMTSIDEEIEKVKEEIRKTPYNKSTERHIGRLKAKLAKLKEEKRKKSKKKGSGEGYGIEKSGDATIVLVGFPSVGKSTLLNALTGKNSEVASYEFTTLKVIPGTLKYKGANLQILDVPGIISGASEGKGRGREVISVLRNVDLLLMLIEPFELEQYEQIREEIYEAGIRLDGEPPDVDIRRKESGGIDISSTKELEIGEEEIRSILRENGIVNADVMIREKLDNDRLIDAIMDNREYIPGIVLVNKIDLVDDNQLEEIKEYAEETIEEEVLYISAEKGDLDILKEKMFEKLDFIRIYLKPQGKEADKDEPMIMERGATVGDLCRKIHRDMENRFRYARIWGESAKHPNQRVGKDHELKDGDIVSVIT